MKFLNRPARGTAHTVKPKRLGRVGLVGMMGLMALAGLPAKAQSGSGAPPVGVSNRGPSHASVAQANASTVRPAQVQIVDDNIRGYYQEGGYASCTAAGPCLVTLTTVPTGHRRLVEHFSCFVYVPSPGVARYVALLANTYAAPRNFFPISRSPADNLTYFVNSPTQLVFEAGEAPVVYAYASGGPMTDLECTVSGRDVTLP